MLLHIVAAAGTSLIASVGLVAAAKYWAERGMVLDHPNARSLHVRPTPRGGGIGIVVPICFAIGTVGLLAPALRSHAVWLVGVGLVIAVVGIVDDARGLPAAGRLLAQAVAAGVVVAGIGSWQTVTWPGVCSIYLGWAAIPLTAIFVVGMTNAYNFMDGIDGIAGAQGVVAGLGWIGVGLLQQDLLLSVAGAAIATASVGFLFFNWSPASIFMGDVGSCFLGFIFAGLCVLVAPRSPAMATAGILFVWPFLFDAVITFLRRVRRRENLLCAHRSHLYQRLVLTGVSHRTVALLYGGLATVGVAVSIALARDARVASVAGAVLIGALAAGLWLVVIWRERLLPEGSAYTQ